MGSCNKLLSRCDTTRAPRARTIRKVTIVKQILIPVAVESVFSHLIALRDALQTNDDLGIQIATAKFEDDLDRLISSRADVGVRGQRVGRITSRQEELRIQDETLRSVVQDLDFAEAATRFANLQTQLQAGLATASQSLSLSLIDFLR